MNRSRSAGPASGAGDRRTGNGSDRPGWSRALPLILAIVGLGALGLAPSPSPSPTPTAGASSSPGSPGPATHTPVLAYYYMWFNSASWTHAKTDVPVLGSYTSTSAAVIKQQVTWAKQAGIDAFIVSWKSTPSLNLALSRLVAESDLQGLKLVLIYEGLDVNRNPLPAVQVKSDLAWFEANYASDPAFDLYGKPAVILSGTWRFTNADIASIRDLLNAPKEVLLLGSDRSAAEYQPRATLFDGDAYYWSSADPLTTPGYQKRLNDLASAVHSNNGLWLAPAAAGFDARLNGGTTVVDRRNGATLTAAWDDAVATNPDGMAVISWNEFTENSYVEPSRNYGERYLQVLALLTGAAGPVHSARPSAGPSPSPSPAVQPSPGGQAGAATGGGSGGHSSPSDWLGSIVVAAIVLGAFALVGFNLRKRGRLAPGVTDRAPSTARNGPTGRTDSLGRPIR